MLSINLLAQDEYEWLGENPSSDTFPKPYYPLYHQWRTYNADTPIIVNTYNTGTGKTKAALLRLLKRAQGRKLRPNRDNALLVAPTNELLAQHVRDAKEFCDENNLPYHVVAITKAKLEKYRQQTNFSEGKVRRAFVLQTILNDASKVDRDTSKEATLYVVNPDIFYYALYFCYSTFDRHELFRNFLQLFNYIIIDEFHYYDAKQLATFLFFIKLSQHWDYIDNARKQRQFCILTATPQPEVTKYLEGLGVAIQWIKPGEVEPTDLPYVRPVRALTPVQLYIYSTEELRQGEQWGGLQVLVEQEKHHIRKLLDDGQDGAIISGSLGTISHIRSRLLSAIDEQRMGRITGPEDSDARAIANKKSLILATPTVDIGYNFERDKPQRQNIDFLFLDAYSGDELVQRIGRAGRVLSKQERNHKSIVYAVVEPEVYKLLQKYDGNDLERSVLAWLARDEMPKRNSLYAYIKTGAVAEIVRPFEFLRKATAEEDLPDLEAFFQEIQQLFRQQDIATRPFTLKDVRWLVKKFEGREKHYNRLEAIPEEAFRALRLRIDKPSLERPVSDEVKTCLEVFSNRLREVAGHQNVGRGGHEISEWVQDDLRAYYVEKARFSFRDSFQPPLALVSDPEHWLSSRDSNYYNALHVLRYYDARYYESEERWRHETGGVVPEEAKDALVYARLKNLRETPLQLGLKLNASEYTQDEWEEKFAYRVTALYRLEVVVRKDHHGLQQELQSLLSSRFVPAFAARDDPSSATANLVRRLRRQARFFPMQLKITFIDGMTVQYMVILGAMAFQVCAEVPLRTIKIDRRKVQLADDSPFIC